MNTHPTNFLLRTSRVALLVATAAAMTAGLSGCHNSGAASHDPNPALHPITTPSGGTKADVDRAALARLVGAWSFEGWSIAADGKRQTASGKAAGAIDSVHFVLLDIRSTVGQMTGSALRTGGSMLFGAEPNGGLCVTAWGDGSNVVRRLTGTVHGNASAFTFREAGHSTSLTLVFETNDQWVAEVRKAPGADQPLIARYVFTRATR